MYRCEALSIAGFIQQLAVAYVANGYFFYVTGCVPAGKDARAVDAKLVERYGIDCSKWVRFRRKQRGLSGVQYLRFRRFFLLLATPGEHVIFQEESRILDIRRKPIQCFGYSVGCYLGRDHKWHPSVRIEHSLFRELKVEFGNLALRGSAEAIRHRFATLPFEPYSPVRRQVLLLFRAVNRARATAGVELLPIQSLRLRRSSISPFDSARRAEQDRFSPGNL